MDSIMQPPPMPFKILALAPFKLNHSTPWLQLPVPVDTLNIDATIKGMEISCYFSIPEDLCPVGGLDIKLSKLKDFHPDALVQNNIFLEHLLEAKNFLTDAKTKNLSAQEKKERLKQWPDLPPIQIESKRDDFKPNTTRTIDDILNMVALPGEELTPLSTIQSGTTQIDLILDRVIRHIFNNENFRITEAAWRGLKLLLQQGDKTGNISVEIVPVTLDTLEETLSTLTVNLIENLPSLVLIDLPFDNSPFCIGLLEKIAQFSETLLVPSMVWITPGFLQLNSWSDLNSLPFLPHYLEEPVFAKWRRLKHRSAASWLAVTCNRFLVRYPYGSDNPPRKFHFNENVHLWTGPVWATSCLIGKSFTRTGWPTRFTDWQNIRVEDLALHTETETLQIPTEVSFSKDRIDQFRRAGIMPLAVTPNKDIAFTPVETTAGGTLLSDQLFVSRITQFILWCRDHLAEGLTGSELEAEIRRAFSLFWENSGHSGLENMEILAGHPKPDHRIPLRIDLLPSRKILPSGEKIQLEFFW